MNNESNLKLFETLTKEVKGLKNAKKTINLGKTFDEVNKLQTVQSNFGRES